MNHGLAGRGEKGSDDGRRLGGRGELQQPVLGVSACGTIRANFHRIVLVGTFQITESNS